MSRYALSHLPDHALTRNLATLVARDRTTTAELLAHIAEFDARRLYLPAAYPSMFAWCLGALHLSEDAAAKRIQAARAARRFPSLFEALADGRLHLTGVGLLAPYLTEENAEGLLAAATHRTKAEIERLLAERFPRPDVPAWVAALPGPAAPACRHAPAHVGSPVAPVPGAAGDAPEHAPAHVEQAPEAVPPTRQACPAPAENRPRLKPLSAESYAVQFTLSRHGHDLLRYAQQLLGHDSASSDIGAVFERALQVLVPHLERRKFAATDRPRARQGRPAADSRHVPAEVRRAVWHRDGGRCTFVSGSGHRCEARKALEFDHVEPYARGGTATVSGIRLRCRAHNQYEAERAYGPEFMRHKRLAAAGGRVAAAGGSKDRDVGAAHEGRIRAAGA